MDAGARRTLSNLIWTVGAFAGTFVLRLGSNMVLTRLLVPEAFGVMVVVNSLRYGVELLTDVGVEQNIVRHKDGLSPRFFNTAWTVQVIRGAGLTAVFLMLSPLLAGLYRIDARVLLLVSFAPFLNALHSTAIFALVKTMEVRRRNLFELTADIATAVITVTLALIWPTVWALVLGTLLSVLFRSAMSYRLPHARHRVVLDRSYLREIVHFGRWIALSSLLVYAATNVDRLALGRLMPLSLLGIYGIARTISDIPTTLAGRLSYQLVFPTLAAIRGTGATLLRADVTVQRRRFLLLGAAVMATGIAWADVVVRILFDPRYHDAGWMLSLLLVGAWFSVLSTLIEALLMGLERPAAMGLSNLARLAVLLPGLPGGFMLAGLPGAIAAVVVGEVMRYVVVGTAQRRLGFSFWRQDVAAMAFSAIVVAAWMLVRTMLGLGLPWAGMTHPG